MSEAKISVEYGFYTEMHKHFKDGNVKAIYAGLEAVVGQAINTAMHKFQSSEDAYQNEIAAYYFDPRDSYVDGEESEIEDFNRWMFDAKERAHFIILNTLVHNWEDSRQNFKQYMQSAIVGALSGKSIEKELENSFFHARTTKLEPNLNKLGNLQDAFAYSRQDNFLPEAAMKAYVERARLFGAQSDRNRGFFVKKHFSSPEEWHQMGDPDEDYDFIGKTHPTNELIGYVDDIAGERVRQILKTVGRRVRASRPLDSVPFYPDTLDNYDERTTFDFEQPSGGLDI